MASVKTKVVVKCDTQAEYDFALIVLKTTGARESRENGYELKPEELTIIVREEKPYVFIK